MPKPVNISASRGAAILGLSSWSSPNSAWLKIMEQREPGFCERNNYEYPVYEESAVLRWGKAFESAVIDLSEEKHGSKIIKREKFCVEGFSNRLKKNDLTKLDPKITCHIDGSYERTSFGILHEGKTTSYFYFRDNFGEPGTDKIPVEYQIQCQHQMICTNATKVILSVLVFPKRVDEWEENGYVPMENREGVWSICRDMDNSKFGIEKWIPGVSSSFDPIEWAVPLDDMGYFHQYEINAHPELQGLMIQHYNKFWEDHVLTRIPPTPVIYLDIKALVRDPVGTILADENIERLMAEYKDIKSEIGTGGGLAKKAEKIKVDVLNWMRDQKSIKDFDDEDSKKWILKNRAGKRIASYGKDKNGKIIFR